MKKSTMSSKSSKKAIGAASRSGSSMKSRSAMSIRKASKSTGPKSH